MHKIWIKNRRMKKKREKNGKNEQLYCSHRRCVGIEDRKKENKRIELRHY